MRPTLALFSPVVVALGVSACSSGPGIAIRPVPVTVQQEATGQIHQRSVTCGVEVLGNTGGIGAVTASGTAVNVGRMPVDVRTRAVLTNPRGQGLVAAGADSHGGLRPGGSWHWTATRAAVALPKGVTDTRLARCVVTTTVGTTP
jgi:hypothetical protein